MEIWGGNHAINKSFAAPGLDMFVYSKPYADSEVGGGDIYYLTSCASGRISRLLLADVCGHGEAASQLAISLRDLMRANVNKISQRQFVEGMNKEFGKVSELSGFATAVVATFFEPKKSLAISVAGHPYPIYYRARRKQWLHLDPAESDKSLGNLPLGIYDESDYPGRKIITEIGDKFLLYSDAFIESLNESHQILGIEGLVQLLNTRTFDKPEDVIPFLLKSIGALSNDNLQEDDATLILGSITDNKVRLRDNLIAPLRLLGKVNDTTHVGKKDN